MSNPPIRMKNPQRFLIGTVACLLASGASLGSVGLAEAPEVADAAVLERQLTSLKEEWARNEEAYARQQRELHVSAKKIRETLCSNGSAEHCQGVNIRKLAYAVAMAETQNCTTGTGKSKNNCHGITACGGGRCTFKTYASPAESYADFERIWLRGYGNRFPTREDARRYVNSEAVDWYRTVTMVYYGNGEAVIPE